MERVSRLKCIYYPKRTTTRRFTAADVARVYCHAIRQGVSRVEISRAIAAKCPETEPECSCAELKQEIELAIKVASLALVILGTLVPALRVLRLIRQARLSRQQAIEAERTIRSLEKTLESKPILEGEYQRLIVRQAELEAQVVIKP